MTEKQDNQLSYEPIPPKNRKFFYDFLAIIAAVALFLLSMQGYFYLIHPEPVKAVTIEDIQIFIPDNINEAFTSHRSDDVKSVLSEIQSSIKQVANFISSKSCKRADQVCQSKALFYFVRDEIKYVPDPQFHDQLENPLITLKTGGADCEDMAVLLIALQKSIGNDVRLVFVPGHAYAQVKIPKYKDRWLNMEATCKDCQWDELPQSSRLEKKTYYEL